ncbi:MAG: MFS transporter, partial [Porticoccaceae bacterium]|nr:MFS transporter [Porticoccaceae bacterium]
MNHVSSADIHVEINERPMSPFQIGVIGLCVMINMLDGFDVMVMPFAAASVSEEWQLSQVFLGLLLTSALVGMAIGSLVLAPFGDVWGRRKLMLLCLCIVTVGMLLSSQVDSSFQLMIFRFLTGLGIGGMLATLNTLVSEFSNNARRGLSISILQSAFPLGAIVGGVISVYLISEYGWRSLFLFGALASMIMIPLVYWKMP